MDPISQGALGAAAASSVAPKRLASFVLLGAVSGVAPDLDFLIRSSTDSLLFLEYHRQFTHALLFIPIGAALCALVSYPAVRRHLSLRATYLACLLGYGTHGLLDACTSYGTQLFWPFSDARVAWNSVSVVDPLFTLPLIALVTAALWWQRAGLARVGFAWAVAYVLFGAWQQERAVAAGATLAQARGHTPVRLDAKPSFANLLVWKLVYEYDGRYYVDAVRLAGTVRYCEGTSVAALDVARDFPWLTEASQQYRDVQRFRWFSEDYLAVDGVDARRIVDIRYSLLPNEISALWGIRLDPDAPLERHAQFVTDSTRRAAEAPRLVGMVLGDTCRPL